MLNYYALKNNIVSLLSKEESINSLIQPIWIDIFDPTPEEEKLIEKYLILIIKLLLVLIVQQLC